MKENCVSFGENAVDIRQLLESTEFERKGI